MSRGSLRTMRLMNRGRVVQRGDASSSPARTWTSPNPMISTRTPRSSFPPRTGASMGATGLQTRTPSSVTLATWLNSCTAAVSCCGSTRTYGPRNLRGLPTNPGETPPSPPTCRVSLETRALSIRAVPSASGSRITLMAMDRWPGRYARASSVAAGDTLPVTRHRRWSRGRCRHEARGHKAFSGHG